MPEITHPEAETQVDLGRSHVSEEQVADVLGKIRSGEDARAAWEVDVKEQYKRRVGQLDDKTWPWPNCANLNIPLTEKMIRRLKPVIVNSVFGPSTIVNFVPVGSSDMERSKRVEIGYDWLVKHRMRDSKKNLILASDAELTYGMGFIKPVWEFRTERSTVVASLDMIAAELGISRQDLEQLKGRPSQELENLAGALGFDVTDRQDNKAFANALKQFNAGKDPIITSYRRVVYNAPYWLFVEPVDIVVPWDSRDDIDDLPWFAHRMYVRPERLLEDGKNGLYNLQAVNEAVESGKDSVSDTDPNSEVFRHERAIFENVHRFQGDANHVEVYEWFGWKDINNDGVAERVVYTVSPRTQKVLRAIEFPYFHGQWPLVKLSYEIRENRWYSSRGLPKLLEHIQSEINAQHNAKLDRLAIQNSLTFKARRGAIDNPQNVTFRPGTFIPVRRMDDLEPISYQPMDFSYDNEVRALKSEAEELVGAIDLSQINARVERRTATEVETINDVSDQILSLEVDQNQMAMKRLHMQTLQLWAQYGEDNVISKVTPDGEEILFRKADLRGGFDIVPAGRLENMSPQVKIRNLLSDLQVASHPAISQFMVWEEIARDYFEARDVKSAQRYLQPPGQFQAGAINKQVAELVWMDKVGEVHPVDLSEPHEIHIQVVNQALDTAQGRAQLLYAGHAALHMIAMGNQNLVQTIQDQFGVLIQQHGNKLHMIQTESPEGAPAAGPQPAPEEVLQQGAA